MVGARLRANRFPYEFPGVKYSIGTPREKFYLEMLAARYLLSCDRRNSDQGFTDYLIPALPFGHI